MERIPPCIVALRQQSKNWDGEPNGSISTIEPLSPFVEYLLRNLHTSISEYSIFFKSFNRAEYSANFNADGFRSLIITLSICNSLATRNPLTPRPDNPSKNIFGPLNFFRNAPYAIIEKSLLTFAFGLKNAGSFGGTLSVNDFFGTIIFVCPSTISCKVSSGICNS